MMVESPPMIFESRKLWFCCFIWSSKLISLYWFANDACVRNVSKNSFWSITPICPSYNHFATSITPSSPISFFERSSEQIYLLSYFCLFVSKFKIFSSYLDPICLFERSNFRKLLSRIVFLFWILWYRFEFLI